MSDPTVPLLPILLGAAAIALYLAAVIFAIVQISKSSELNSTERSIWIIGVVLAPVWGAIAWYALGPHPFGLRVSRNLP
ncbi:PLDc N-terminal domain-containing protein [Herbiconiux sp. VKM Ac-2851]|uniref:PLDc N-terminal domain-containing protein n=1 Tax=Herbiconiux sp. VKM Ac-2851 TaxID=2739025 RepID=UPI001565CE25|nr:PLDc N-terminal domain-containing protein [Herbiconiux sp. VKM Ac-2851]